MEILYLKEFKEAVETLLEAKPSIDAELMQLAKDKGIDVSRGIGYLCRYYANHIDEFDQLPKNQRLRIVNLGKSELKRKALNYTWQNTKNRSEDFVKKNPEFWGNQIDKKTGTILDKDKFINSLNRFIMANPDKVEKINPAELITQDNKFNVNHPWVKNINNREAFSNRMFEPWFFSPEQINKSKDDITQLLIARDGNKEAQQAYNTMMRQRDENWKNTRQILKHDPKTGEVGQEDFAKVLAGKEDKLNIEDNLLDFADYDIVDEAKSGNELRAIKNLRNFMKTYKKEPTIIKMFKDYCLTSLAKNGIETELLADELM